VRQVRFEVLNIATEANIPAFFREVVLRFQPKQVVCKHSPFLGLHNSTGRNIRSAAQLSVCVMLKKSALD
jgi:hypothetical protein